MIQLYNMWQTLQRPCSCTFRGSTYFDGRFVELCMLDRAETSYGIETWKRSHLLVESTWNELPLDWICQYEHSKVPSGINYLENSGSKNPAQPKLSLFPFVQVKRLSSFGFGQAGMGKAWKRISEGNHEVGDQNISNPQWVTGWCHILEMNRENK